MKNGITLIAFILFNTNLMAASLVCQFKIDQDASLTISNDMEHGFMVEVDSNLQDVVDGETITDKKSLAINFQGSQIATLKVMTKSPVTVDFEKMTLTQNQKTVDLECLNSEKPAQELASILGEDPQGFTYAKPADREHLTTAYVTEQNTFEADADRVPASK